METGHRALQDSRESNSTALQKAEDRGSCRHQFAHGAVRQVGKARSVHLVRWIVEDQHVRLKKWRSVVSASRVVRSASEGVRVRAITFDMRAECSA